MDDLQTLRVAHHVAAVLAIGSVVALARRHGYLAAGLGLVALAAGGFTVSAHIVEAGELAKRVNTQAVADRLGRATAEAIRRSRAAGMN